MGYKFVNNYRTLLSAELTTGQTSMTVDDASPIADASAADPYKLTLVEVAPSGDEVNWEVVHATGVSGNVVTIVREQDGTTSPASWPITTTVEARVTAEHLDSFALSAPGTAESETIYMGDLSFDSTGNLTYTVQAGRKLYVDFIEIVPLLTGNESGTWATITTPSYAATARVVLYSNDGSWLVVCQLQSPFFDVLDTATMTSISPGYTAPGNIFAAAFNSTDTQLALGCQASPYIIVLDTSSWTPIAGTPTTPFNSGVGVTYSHDDSLLVFSGFSNFNVWETTTWTQVAGAPSSVPAGNARDSAFSSDDSLLAVATTDTPYIIVYDTSDWSVVDTSSVSATINDIVYTVKFSPDDAYLAFGGSFTGGISVATVADWSVQALATQGSFNYVYNVDFRPTTGELAVAVVGATNGLWHYTANTFAYDEIATIAAGGQRVSYKPDGSQLAVGTDLAPDYLFVYEYTVDGVQPSPTVNVGTDVTNNDTILAAQTLSPFVAYERYSYDPAHNSGVDSVYVEVGTPEVTGSLARVVIRGYSIDE